jgi:hypothetical protein
MRKYKVFDLEILLEARRQIELLTKEIEELRSQEDRSDGDARRLLLIVRLRESLWKIEFEWMYEGILVQ